MDTLRCEGLRKSYDGVAALAGVDLTFPPAGVVAVVGPNGAGKTTLLDVLTGFVRPNAGHCFLGHYELTGLKPYRVANLGVARTFQELRLIGQVSALENVLLACPRQRGERLLPALLGVGVAHDEARHRAAALGLLGFVGLAGAIDLPAGELSYGQQKLLALACCLGTGARILLLDEPVAGVHPQMAEQVLGLLRALRDEGKLVVFIEHDLAFVRGVADRVVVLDEGKVVAVGAPQEVFNRPDILEAYLA